MNISFSQISTISQILLSGFIGAFIALWLNKFNNPDVEISANEKANTINIYPEGYVVPGRWKFYRVRVKNKPVTRLFSCFFTRETAEQLHATIKFNKIDKTMKGRWAETLELPFANPSDQMRLANFPDPENIFAGEDTILDVFAKRDGDREAYGWNNESYLNSWKTPNYKLEPGNYNIEITVAGLNVKKRNRFRAHIADTIERTTLENVD